MIKNRFRKSAYKARLTGGVPHKRSRARESRPIVTDFQEEFCKSGLFRDRFSNEPAGIRIPRTSA
eukprot:scaffold51152_cov61-Phaeocystis_antarctica.AAC.2